MALLTRRIDSGNPRVGIIVPFMYLPRKFACGHFGAMNYAHEIEGERAEWNVRDPSKGPCMRCSVPDAIDGFARCPGCKRPIMIGDMVMIMLTDPQDHGIPDVRFFGKDKSEVLVCCRRDSCGIGDFTGWWNGKEVDRPKI